MKLEVDGMNEILLPVLIVAGIGLLCGSLCGGAAAGILGGGGKKKPARKKRRK